MTYDVTVIADTIGDVSVYGDEGVETIDVPEQGPPGSKGDKGDKGASILSGYADPTALDGATGDYFFNRNSTVLFGPKTSGAWGTGVSLVGLPGADGNTILSGTIDPAAGVGAEGNFYINTATHLIFGPKAGGSWPAGVSLIGPQGVRGSAFYALGGAPGTIAGQRDGDQYLDTGTGDVYTLTGGSWGVRVGNIHGSVWYNGSGSPSVASPRQNDQWLDTSNGDVYLFGGSVWTPSANIRGLTGATGTRGSVWYSGAGAPGTLAGRLDGDFYYNTTNCDVYKLISGAWTLQNNIKGSTGTTGSTGARGSLWNTGSGAPGTITGQAANDEYLNTSNGDVYQYSGSAWSNVGNIKGSTGSTGPTGTRGSLWNYGAGAPGTITGQINGDLYLNTNTDDLYQLISGTWTIIANIRGFNSVAHVPGTTTADAAAAGQLGEYVTGSGGGNFTASATVQNFGAITIPSAGDWGVAALAVFGGSGGTTSSDWIFNLSNISTPSLSGNIHGYVMHARQPGGQDYAICLTYPEARYSAASANTLYMHCQATFSGSTFGVQCYGHARRLR